MNGGVEVRGEHMGNIQGELLGNPLGGQRAIAVQLKLVWSGGMTGFTHKALGEFKFKATYYCQFHIISMKSSDCYI